MICTVPTVCRLNWLLVCTILWTYLAVKLLNGSTCASSFNVIIVLCRVCTSSVLYNLVGNLFLLAHSSLLMARHLSWYHWHQEARTRHQSHKSKKHYKSRCTYLLQSDDNIVRVSPLVKLRLYQLPNVVVMKTLQQCQLPPVPRVHYDALLHRLFFIIKYLKEHSF